MIVIDYILKLSSAVTGFSIDSQFIDCICATKVIKADKFTGNIVMERELFKKEGLSRNLISNNDQIIIKDFCMLYILNKLDYSLIKTLQLGTDLSSDICGITADENNIYAAIRNGKITVINKESFDIKTYTLSDNSMWDIQIYKDYLIGGTVDGKLLIIDKAKMNIKETIELGKQNINSIFLDGDIAYTAGQDKKLCKIDLLEFKITTLKKPAHKKMFHCIGIYEDSILTVSHPCNEIAFWKKDTLDFLTTINMPLSLCGSTFIEDNLLYITSRNIQGIALVNLLQ